jgi:hypothetical protein
VCDAAYSPLIEPDGNVFACCGPAHFCRRPSPLFLGNAKKEPLQTILSRGLNDPILKVISSLGPYGLYLLLKNHPIAAQFRARSEYSGFCELCLDITNEPELVSAIRERLLDIDVDALVALAQRRRHQLTQSRASQEPMHALN